MVLAVAELNLEIVMASQLSGCDIPTFEEAGRLLKQKLKRAGVKKAAVDQFSQLLQITSVPDIEAAVQSHRVDVRELWAARETNAAKKFRKWRDKTQVSDTKELAALYNDALSKVPFGSKPSVRAIRWVVTTGAPELATLIGGQVAGQIAGAVISAADSWFVDKWLNGYSPRLFIEELKKLRVEPEP